MASLKIRSFALERGARIFKSGVYIEVNEHFKNECNKVITQKDNF